MNRDSVVYFHLKKIYSFVFRNEKLLQLRYIIFEKLFGIDIKFEHAEDASAVHPDNMHYQPLYTYYLKKLMKCISIGAADKLLDYGSGKGMAMIFFARYSFCKIDGVELIQELHKIALKNIARKKLTHLTSYNEDVTKYNDIDQYNYYFFYNPFCGKVMN
jgi:hypothetical protein